MAGHPPLHYRDLFVFLPFQANTHKFAYGINVMSYDITAPPPAMQFLITVKNVNGLAAKTSYYDPIQDRGLLIDQGPREPNAIALTVEAVEYPRLLVIEEQPGLSTTVA